MSFIATTGKLKSQNKDPLLWIEVVDGKVFRQGSLVSAYYTDMLDGKQSVTLIAEPDEKSSISSVSASKNRLIVNMLSNVNSELFSYEWKDGNWFATRVDSPDYGSFEVGSADSTMVPYFVVGPKDMEYKGRNPTLLYAYGGFEVSMLPSYSEITGKLWLENGVC